MKLKLIGLLITLSFYPVGVQATNDQQSIYEKLAEYLHLTFNTKIIKDQTNLWENKDSFTKEEFKIKHDKLLCAQLGLHVEYQNFLKKSNYKPSPKATEFLKQEETTLERDFKKYEPDCSLADEYIEKLLISVLGLKDEL